MEDLKAIREEIDAIDAQLLPLLCRRMDCSLRVAAYKATRGLPVLNAEREGQILDRVRAACREEGRGEYAEAAALVFSSTMDVSRALQHRVLGAGRPLREALEGAVRRATAFTRLCVQHSMAFATPVNYGVDLEPLLPRLWDGE